MLDKMKAFCCPRPSAEPCQGPEPQPAGAGVGFTGRKGPGTWPVLVLMLLAWALPGASPLAQPQVTITANPASIQEGGPPGSFLVRVSDPEYRCSLESTVVRVSNAFGGTAIFGQDYQVEGWNNPLEIQLVPGPDCDKIGLAEGEVAIPIRATADTFIEGSEVVVLTSTTCTYPFAPGAADFPCNASASMTIIDATQSLISVVSGDGQLASSRQPLQPFVVLVSGAAGPIAGQEVRWTIEQGDGSLSTTAGTTNATGQTTTVLTPGNETQFRVRATLAQTGDWVEFSALVSSPLAGLPGLTPGQISVGGALDSLCPRLNVIGQQRPLTAGEQDLLAQCRKLLAATGEDTQAAVEGIVALTPEQASAPRKLMTQISSLQVINLVERLRELRRGARGVSLGGLKVGLADQTFSGSMLEQAFKPGRESGGGASADEDWPFERLGLFITGDVQWGKKDQSINEDGFDYDRLGLTAGADYRFTNGLILGGALGYTSTGVDIDADGGTLDDESWSMSVYGTYYPTEHFYLEGSATYGWDRYDQDRNIEYSLLETKRTANAGFDGDQYTLMFGAGYDLIRGGTIFDLYGRLQYTSASLDSYREEGANGLDLIIQGQDAISFKSILGTQVSRSISTRSAVLSLQGWVQWEHEFEDGDEEVTGYFANDPNQFGFVLPVDALETDLVRLGLGVGAQFGQGRTAFLSYQAALGMQDYTEQIVTAGVSVAF